MLKITHTFTAPQEKLWQAWTQAEQLKQWYGPKGISISHSVIDFKLGGAYHSCMKISEERQMWGKWVFTEINQPESLKFMTVNSNEAGETMAMENWPLEILTTVIFTEQDGKTKMVFTFEPHNASVAEQQCFEGSIEHIQQGWNGAFEKLATLLSKP